MDKIGFTWDRRRESVYGVMPFSGIGEDLAHGTVRWTMAWLALFCWGHCDAEDGGGAVHAGMGWCGGRGCSRTEGGARSHMFEGGGDGVCTEDVEGVAGLF